MEGELGGGDYAEAFGEVEVVYEGWLVLAF